MLIWVMLDGIVTDESAPHKRKTLFSINVTEDGMVALVSLEQPSNALASIEMTEDGMLNEVIDEQSLNAPEPIRFSEPDTVTLLSFSQPSKAYWPILITPPIDTEVSEVQFWKALLPMICTDEGSDTEVMAFPLKASLSIAVTDFLSSVAGTVTLPLPVYPTMCTEPLE